MKSLNLKINPLGFVFGSIIPDIDFILFVPFLGRVKGHRTVTHSLLFISLLSFLLRNKYGFFSVFWGGLLHLVIDDLDVGIPPGVSWFWPIIPRRFRLFQL